MIIKNNIKDIDDYIKFIFENPDQKEVSKFLSELWLSEYSFFQDLHHFAFRFLLPHLSGSMSLTLSITKTDYTVSMTITVNGDQMIYGNITDFSINDNGYTLKAKSESDSGEEYDIILTPENNSTNIKITDYKNLSEE